MEDEKWRLVLLNEYDKLYNEESLGREVEIYVRSKARDKNKAALKE